MQEARPAHRWPSAHSWRCHPCLGQPGPLRRLCSASMGHSAEGSGGQWCPLCQEAVLAGSIAAPRWASFPRKAGECLLGAGRGARKLSGDKHMSLCTCCSSCLECPRISCPSDVGKAGCSRLGPLLSFLPPALSLSLPSTYWALQKQLSNE